MLARAWRTAIIVVTGATGKLGSQIVEALLGKMPADKIGVSVRDPGKAVALAEQGVRVRQGDFTKPDRLASAFEGASQVLIVSSNARAYGGDPHAQQRAAIEAARAAGARRIVYTSHMGVSATSAFGPMHDHAAAEAMLMASGVAWTALRNGFYASTVPMMIGDAATSGVIAAPADGKVSWTAHHDLAAAAAAVLVDEGRFDGPTPPLTGSEALDLADVAAIVSHFQKRPVRRELVTEEQMTAAMAARGVPEAAVAIMLGMHRAAHAGEFSVVDPTLAALIGRPPTRLREVLSRAIGTAQDEKKGRPEERPSKA